MRAIANQERKQRTRNPDASKKAILDAAEELFSDKGFDATSVNDISVRAGVSRGTPSYFFGSKEGLYRSVLERAFGGPRLLVAELRAELENPDLSPAEALALVSGTYFDYLVDHPRFIRLVQWEALNGGAFLGDVSAHLESLEAGVSTLMKGLSARGNSQADSVQLLIDMIALCWFPLAHGPTLLRALGIDAGDPAFLAERKRQVVATLTATLTAAG